MGLPTTSDLKTYLRIETSHEDNLIKDLLEEAVGLIEMSIGKSLTTEMVSWTDDVATGRAYDVVTSLMIKKTPIDPTTIVVNGAGGLVDATKYVVAGSLIQGKDYYVFDDGPYTITATGGYGTLPSYAKRELPMIRMLVMDVAAFLYQQRTPGAGGEGSAGASVNYQIDSETGLPDRIAKRLRKLRGILVA